MRIDDVLRGQHVDAWLRLTGLMTARDFVQMLDGNLHLLLILETEFERRFPKEWEQWHASYKTDGIE